MAKRKVVSLGGKKFSSIVVLCAIALGLIVTTLALQKPTNTESEASCIFKPMITYTGSKDEPDVVVYKFNINNPCSKLLSYGLKINNQPSSSWRFRFSINGSSWIDNYIRGSIWQRETDNVRLRVVPPTSARNGTYHFTLAACRWSTTTYNLLSGSSNCSYKYLTYVKD